jgi:hypothetical protein
MVTAWLAPRISGAVAVISSAGYQTDTIDTSQYNTRIIPYQTFDTQVTSDWWYQTLY